MQTCDDDVAWFHVGGALQRLPVFQRDAVAQFQNALGIVHVNGLLHDVQTLPGVGQTLPDTIFETSFVVICAETFLLGAVPH